MSDCCSKCGCVSWLGYGGRQIELPPYVWSEIEVRYLWRSDTLEEILDGIARKFNGDWVERNTRFKGGEYPMVDALYRFPDLDGGVATEQEMKRIRFLGLQVRLERKQESRYAYI